MKADLTVKYILQALREYEYFISAIAESTKLNVTLYHLKALDN